MTTTHIPLATRQHTLTTEPTAAGAEFTASGHLRNTAQSYRLRRRQVLRQLPLTPSTIVRSVVAAEHSALPSGRTMVELLYPGDIISPSLLHLTPGSPTPRWLRPSSGA
jgi:hypothetical protein